MEYKTYKYNFINYTNFYYTKNFKDKKLIIKYQFFFIKFQ